MVIVVFVSAVYYTITDLGHCHVCFYSVLVLLLILVTAVLGSVRESPQQIVNKYNNYRTICDGLGYQNDGKGTIAFQSSLRSHLVNMGNQQTVIFDKVTLNKGKGYNKKTGIFTAPDEGVYTFSWTILSMANTYFISEIVHDGKPVGKNYTDGRGRNGYVMSSTNTNIKMKKGDKAWIRTYFTHGKFAHGEDWSIFSGNKI
ncbi:complement C1q tumor necrosis factor-related protein 7-like [Saccostrea echinata]|uniref:complement C1q tumor necrosis factor-related protein 7-like n=1 Tax=Saccostrea echinata TaxID=191078 RepID=UPI002A7F56D9|nr:complement C1q tumor necrosis factor-related protein 7-like [Saccostrea echinata]